MKAVETTILRLLQGSKVFLVPNFQRRYSWRSKEWELLWADLIREHGFAHAGTDESSNGHFLGSIVLHPATSTASILAQHLVVDGQQRLTTILVLLAAIRDVRRDVEENWDGSEYDVKYLTNPYDDQFPDRLKPTELDRRAFSETVRNSQPTDGVGQAYVFFRRRIENAVRDEGMNPKALGETLLLRMLLVEINTSIGDSVNNIFNTLNSKGLPLSASDLVRNELLLHIGENLGDAAYKEHWIPIEETFFNASTGKVDDRQFITFLWSREVVHDPATTRQDLFAFFERRLRKSLAGLAEAERRQFALDEFAQIHSDSQVFEIVRHPADANLDILSMTSPLRGALIKLVAWGSEPSTPLALWLTKSAITGRISEQEAGEAVETLLGYLIRRALAGVPTNLLNRLLTPLPARLDADEGRSPSSALREILSQKGYYWPRNSEVEAAIPSQPILASARRQVRFLLEEAEEIAQGSSPEMDAAARVTRIMPEELSSSWREDIKASGEEVDEALALVNTLGNLALRVPAAVDYSSFEGSRGSFEIGSTLDESLIESGRFNPSLIRERSLNLARLLMKRYPGPTEDRNPDNSASARQDRDRDAIEFALQSLPSESWTTDAVLSMHSGSALQDVRSVVLRLDPSIARLVRDPSGAIPSWFDAAARSRIETQTQSVNPAAFVDTQQLEDVVRDAVDSDEGADDE
ncbi:DUF262 domain-containing protein [Curtobacterium sp. UCD-KPL2560]|uniref:GmrSD restriction endonuclease domain-containing protein n=1 Tax=Curtobacterium sp. UCD-KPL2560 TaxID=1885315 RepID=UPI0009F2215E|nr:DUF262 domain-containing protein [Curtobacterium sp. UCD-KPL2560]